jgi:hypothetical protein
VSRLAKRPKVDHATVAAALRANPGQWLPVGDYRSTTSGDGVIRDIRSAYARHARPGRHPYSPAGSFEARMERTEDGVRVHARYIGTKGGTK